MNKNIKNDPGPGIETDQQQQQQQQATTAKVEPYPRYPYRCVVQYKGTEYQGWQIQRRSESEGRHDFRERKSVQGEINMALAKLCQDPEIHTIGASRTDAGVHALGQVFKATLPIEVPVTALTKGLNSLLPKDIRVIKAEPCTPDFNPRFQAQWKEYFYVFSISEESLASPFTRDLVAYYPFRPEFIDWEKMEVAAKMFQGNHNFINFYCEGSEVRSHQREIFLCKLGRIKNETDFFPNIDTSTQNFFTMILPEYYVLRVIGSGFMKQMIRLMVGTIWNIGRGKTSLSELAQALEGVRPKSASKLGIVAPPMGLYLKEVSYLPYSKTDS